MESINKYSIKYISNYKQYLIEIMTEKSELIMKFTEEDNSNVITSFFQGKFNFNELKEQNKFLSIYDSIEDLSQFLKQIIGQNKLLITNESNSIKTEWFFMKGISEDKIELILIKKDMEKDDIIYNLVKEIKNLKLDNLKINEKFIEMEKKYNLLENQIKCIPNNNSYIYNTLSNSKGLINKILTNQNEADEFARFLFRNNNMSFQLLYQATRDGDNVTDIIEKIKGFSPTLFLLYTSRGFKCGGFTRALWSMDFNYKKDSSAFLFNFNNRKIQHIKNQKQAIICNKDHAVVFGDYHHSDFFIRNQFLKKQVYEAQTKHNYFSNDYDILGEPNSIIYELEIYHCKSLI